MFAQPGLTQNSTPLEMQSAAGSSCRIVGLSRMWTGHPDVVESVVSKIP